VISIALSEVCNILGLNVFEVNTNKEPIDFSLLKLKIAKCYSLELDKI